MMLNHDDAKKIAFEKLMQIKGKQYLVDNKEKLYTCWDNSTKDMCNISILVDDTDMDDLFDNEGNLHVDETIKPKERFDFEVNLITGECKYVS